MKLEKKVALLNQKLIDIQPLTHTKLFSKDFNFDWKQVWGTLPGGDFGG